MEETNSLVLRVSIEHECVGDRGKVRDCATSVKKASPVRVVEGIQTKNECLNL